MGAQAHTRTPVDQDLSTIGPFVTAAVTVGGTWLLFEPKLQRISAIKAETGRFELGFILFYVVPQWVLLTCCVLAALFLFGAAWDAFAPLPALPFADVRELFETQKLVAVVIVLAFLGVVIKWNWLPWILLGLAWGISLLPIPGIRNRFGRTGESVGWHQASVVCRGPDKGLPLLVDRQQVDRMAWELLARLSENAGTDNYAAEPAGLPAKTRANIALFGCILESVAYANAWPKLKWAEFYASLGDIQRNKGLFAPSDIRQYPNGQAYFEALRGELETALVARKQPPPPHRSLAAAADIVRTWELLTKKAKGNVLGLCPIISPLIGGSAFWLDLRLRSFPQLDSDGMRPQLIKLLTRWRVLPVGRGAFVQPFAKRIAWLLLQGGALRALPDVKEVTFHGAGQVPIARLAMKKVLQATVKLIEREDSAEAKAAARQIGASAWSRFETADFVLWSWASDEHRKAIAGNWDKSKWRWKFEDDRVQRVA